MRQLLYIFVSYFTNLLNSHALFQKKFQQNGICHSCRRQRGPPSPPRFALINYLGLLHNLYLCEEKHIDSRYEIIAQRPKGIKWSAVPLPCSTFFLVFMGGSRAAALIGDKVLKNGKIFRLAGWLAGHQILRAGPQSWLAGPQAWLAGPQSWLTGPQSWLTGPHSWLAGPQAWLTGPQAWLVGHQAWLDGPKRGSMGGLRENIPILQYFVPY